MAGNVSSIVLPNYIWKETYDPEFVDGKDCSGLALSGCHFLPLLQQMAGLLCPIEAFKKLQRPMLVAPHSPADRAPSCSGICSAPSLIAANEWKRRMAFTAGRRLNTSHIAPESLGNIATSTDQTLAARIV